MSMAVIVPSRGRPQNIAALIVAWVETDAHAELHVVLDDDDPTLDEYDPIVHPQRVPKGVNMTTWVGPRRRLGGSLNHLAPHVAKFVDVVGFMGDDHRPRTPRWDQVIFDNCPPAGVVYGNDLIQGSNLPTAVFVDPLIIKTLGWMVLPGQVHLFMDNLWKTLGEQLGTLRYLPDVIIEHLHPIAGKAEWDEGYTEANAAHVWDHDEVLYKEWVAHQMPADIARIKAAL